MGLSEAKLGLELVVGKPSKVQWDPLDNSPTAQSYREGAAIEFGGAGPYNSMG